MLTPKEKNPLYQKLRGASNPRRCITEDSEPNTLPTELFRPPIMLIRNDNYIDKDHNDDGSGYDDDYDNNNSDSDELLKR